MGCFSEWTFGFILGNILTNSEAVKNMAYKQFVHPVLEYAFAAWNSASDTAVVPLQAVQRMSARVIWGIRRMDRKTSTTGFLRKLDLKSLSERQSDRWLIVFSQYHHSSNTAINNYVQRVSFASAGRHTWQYFIPHTNTLHYPFRIPTPPLPTVIFCPYCQRLERFTGGQSTPYATECLRHFICLHCCRPEKFNE